MSLWALNTLIFIKAVITIYVFSSSDGTFKYSSEYADDENILLQPKTPEEVTSKTYVFHI